jgi:hypothetical protein
MSMGTQNMKTGPNALGTLENEYGDTKHEIGTRRPRYRRNESGSEKMKTGAYNHGTAENVSGSAKQGNGTRRPRNSRK